MDWFQVLTGFPESGYRDTRSRLEVRGDRLVSKVTGAVWGVGQLELVSLRALRERIAASKQPDGRLKVSELAGDVRTLHRRKHLSGALFQVASQFNLLEMIGPGVTPEDGVTRYAGDPTQGPACAIAAGAATIFRNYFATVDGEVGQTATRQLDGLADVGGWLAQQLHRPVTSLWEMRNGYALCSADGLAAIEALLRDGGEALADEIRQRVKIGLHLDVEVTDNPEERGQTVCQAFCSALPVAYSAVPRARWGAFGLVVLEAAYEATLAAGLINARRGRSNLVLLTRLGGGAFGNDPVWIDAAMERAFRLATEMDLDVRIVSRTLA